MNTRQQRHLGDKLREVDERLKFRPRNHAPRDHAPKRPRAQLRHEERKLNWKNPSLPNDHDVEKQTDREQIQQRNFDYAPRET